MYLAHQSNSYRESRVIMYNELACYDDLLFLLYSSTAYPWKCHAVNGEIPNWNYVNAEHIVPQSLFDEKRPMVADLHHLAASDAKGNNGRSNYRFKEIDDMSLFSRWCKNFECVKTKPSVDIESYGCAFKENGIWSWQPVPRDRGRIARAVLYFYTMYDEYYGGGPTISNIGDINMFLKWNREFPPTDWEREMNEKINMTQGNRNPYVDNPIIAEKAWSEFA